MFFIAAFSFIILIIQKLISYKSVISVTLEFAIFFCSVSASLFAYLSSYKHKPMCNHVTLTRMRFPAGSIT